MKCAEVIEWMHRYLDHDLSREEITEMFHHIDHCLHCAEIFDRLTMLSRELEQLPDVKPPFSLVDSILPKLDELDRGILSSEQGGSEDKVVVPFNRSNTQEKRKMGSSMARRTGIGAVAAAIILGVAIFNMPEQIPGAQVEEMMNSSSNNAVVGSNAAGTMNADRGDSAGTGPAQNSQAGDSIDPEARIAESAAPAIGATESFIAGTEEAEPSADSTAGDDSSPRSIVPQTSSNKTPKQQPTATPSRNKTGAGGIQPGSGGERSPGDSNAFADPEVKASMQPKVDQEQGIMSLVPVSPSPSHGELSWTSPDSTYAAVVEDQKLVIYSIPASDLGVEKTMVFSIPLEGKWVSGEWTPDSLHFIYVTHTNGMDVQKVYAVAGTSAAGPSPTPGESSTK